MSEKMLQYFSDETAILKRKILSFNRDSKDECVRALYDSGFTEEQVKAIGELMMYVLNTIMNRPR